MSIGRARRLESGPGVLRAARQRTVLAWERFGLELGVVSAVSARVLPPRLGAWYLAVAMAGLVVAAVSVIGVLRAQRTGTDLALAPATRYGLVALLVTVIGLCGVLWLFSGDAA